MLFLTLIAAVMVAIGCGDSDDDGGDGGGSGSASADCDTEGSSQGVSEDTIKLGAFLPLSGPAAPIGIAHEGSQAYFDMVNANGGVQGRQIEYEVVDDKYDPNVARQAVQRLDQQEEIFALSGGVGTPNFVAALPYIKANEIPAVAPYAPSNQIGTMENPQVYMVWATFVTEFRELTNYVVEERGAKKVAIMTMAGDVGDDALAGTEEALEAQGMELAGVVESEATTTDFAPIALQLRETGADWVLMIQTPTGMIRAIKAMERIGFTPSFAGHSDNADTAFVKPAGQSAEGFITALKVSPTTSDNPQIKEFVDTYTEKYGELPPEGEPSWQAVGWVSAALTVDALERAPALTRPCLEWALQNTDGLETGFLPPITFGPEIRQGVEAVGIGEIKDGKVIEARPPVALGGDIQE